MRQWKFLRFVWSMFTHLWGANKQLSFYLWTSQTSRITCLHAVTPEVWKQLLLSCTILKSNWTDLDARAMSEEGLGALRVVQGSVTHAAPRSPDGELPTVKQVPWAVAVLSCFIHYLQRHQNNLSSTTHAASNYLNRKYYLTLVNEAGDSHSSAILLKHFNNHFKTLMSNVWFLTMFDAGAPP